MFSSMCDQSGRGEKYQCIFYMNVTMFMFYQIIFTFSRMSDFPKVLDWNQGLVSNLFFVYQLSLQSVI